MGSGHIHNTKFLHYDTQSPGKGNALTIGNEIAVQDHPIAFCVDANNFPEPDALAYLYRDAYEHMIRNPDGTAVLSGRHIGETNMDGVDFLGRVVANAKKIKQQNKKIRHRKPHEVTGALMAWDTQWLASVGGFPNTAAMDYGIGAIARYSGRTVAHSQDAVIWGFTPNNFTEKLNHASRSMRGKLQLIAQYPGLRELIVTDEPFWFENKFTNRLADLLHNVKDNPKNFPSAAYQWIIWELARRDGTQEYAQNPKNPSWDIITSTK